MRKIILVILVSGLAFFTRTTYDINTLNTCFEKSGAQLVKEAICAWSEIYTSDSAEMAAEKLFESVCPDDSFGYFLENGMYCISSSTDDHDLAVKARYLDSQGSIYAYLEYSQHDTIMNINNMRRSIEDAFHKYSEKVSFSVLIQGRYNKKMSTDEMKEKAGLIFKASNTSYVDGMEDGGLVSLCGFSSLLPNKEAVTDDGRSINLNVALRTSETYGCTYIWIGYPIITIEY